MITALLVAAIVSAPAPTAHVQTVDSALTWHVDTVKGGSHGGVHRAVFDMKGSHGKH
jgi:hypothetical protein